MELFHSNQMMYQHRFMDSFDLFKLDGHALRIFASVCETGSVSRTAEIVDLNQSTISHTLEKMRTALRDPLFVKSGRGITPTEKALAILPRVQKILSDIEGLVAPEKYDATFDFKPVVIAIPTPALHADMKRVHARLLEVEPSVTFELKRMAPSSAVSTLLSNDDADLAITVAGNRYPATLDHCRYGRDDFVIFYDPECRDPVATVEAYAEANHAVVGFGSGGKSVVERAIAEAGIKRKVSLVSPTTSMLGDLIKGTNIIATMPRQLANSIYRNLSFCAPPLKLPTLNYDLVWHRRYEHSGRNTWLRKLVLEARETGEQTG
ncbi:MAG: LysR family transcriptional regulator [Silicimonas sp.]|jgi:DNA-binding transcriptional LysR family regulator|nr:LysR family transcriptional regulator [Silicimonas sp.]